MSSASSSRHVLLGIGNPLLDISANVDQSFLDKYDVKLNNAILAEAKHQPMYTDLVKSHSVEYIAGGATQNSIRVAQWMLNQPNSTSYIGCIGQDDFGKQLRKSAEADGVNVQYLVNEKEPTGTCAVLINNKERSLIANLGAANHYQIDHLKTEPIQALIKESKIFYSSGFFLTVSPPSLLSIAEHALTNDKIVCINLAAIFIVQFFSEPLLSVLPYADYVFGNESEAEAFGKQQKLDDVSVENVALKLAEWSSKKTNRKRYAIITQGSKSTVVAYDGKVTSYDVPALESDKIVDSNGAGDAFVGGFLSQIALGRDVKTAVEAGHYAARTILQVSGCAIPKSAAAFTASS